jgi:hypothetical protein
MAPVTAADALSVLVPWERISPWPHALARRAATRGSIQGENSDLFG